MHTFSFRAGRRTGAAREAGHYVLVPEAWVVTLGWPGGGYVWNWPTGLWVIDGSRTQHVALLDVTKVACWALYLLAFFVVVATGVRRDSRA